jgi:hypothetical protein
MSGQPVKQSIRKAANGIMLFTFIVTPFGEGQAGDVYEPRLARKFREWQKF